MREEQREGRVEEGYIHVYAIVNVEKLFIFTLDQ